MHCTNCGHELDPDDSYCDNCRKMLGGLTGGVAESADGSTGRLSDRALVSLGVGLVAGVAGIVFYGGFSGVAVGSAVLLYRDGERAWAAVVGALGLFGILLQLLVLLSSAA